MKLDKKLAEAIVNLRGHPAFECLKQAIQEDAAEALLACAKTDGNALFRCQGKFNGLNEWLNAFDAAREELDKLT